MSVPCAYGWCEVCEGWWTHHTGWPSDQPHRSMSHGKTQRAFWMNDTNTSRWEIQAVSRTMLSTEPSRSSVIGCRPRRGEFSWTELISQHTKSGQFRRALNVYEEMRKDGVEPSSHTFVALLKACSSLQNLKSVRDIHSEVVRCGFETDVYVGTMLVDAYAKSGSLENARRVFEEMPHRDVVSWNAMITGYAKMEKGKEALQLFTRMQQEGAVLADERTYVGALKACSIIAESGQKSGCVGLNVRKQCLETVTAIHADVRNGGFESNSFVGTMLVDAYAKCGSVESARKVFENMPEHSVVSWTAMILGYALMGKGEDALQLYREMQQDGVDPNDRTYVSVLKACSRIAELGEREGGDGTLVKHKCLETVRAIHADIAKGEFGSNVFVGNMLVDVYAKCGSLENARRVFEGMPHRDVVSWNSLIGGYAQMERGQEALQLYVQMQHEGVVPNDRTYVGVLKACSIAAESGKREGDGWIHARKLCLETVTTIHRDLKTGKFESDVFVGTMLVDAYAKCWSLENARRVFEAMPQRDVVSWTAMILGYAEMEKGEEALKLYAQMEQEGVMPNSLTFVAALNACGSMAGLAKGKQIHAQILQAGLECGSFLTSSLIDMYGKCSSMLDAQQVFDAMATREVAAWNALIVGHARQGESEVVFQLFNRMGQEGVKPDGITFLGLLSVCSHVGLVDMGEKYFEAMSRDYGIFPTIQHYNCMVDLLGRAGQVQKALEVVKMMPFQPESAVWKCVLGACQKWGHVELGRIAFEGAIRSDACDAAPYALMSNIYAAAQMLDEAKKIQAMRVKSRAWKEPGQSWWVDMSGIAHAFVAGDGKHPECENIFAKLGDLMVQITTAGYAPNLDSIDKDILDDEEEGSYGQGKTALALAGYYPCPR